MTDLSDFPITARWPAKDPSVLQLYSFPTPNGVKVSIALEEMGIPYEAHTVTLSDSDVKSPEFLSLNPNNKIPAIVDPNAEGGPLGLFESGAIKRPQQRYIAEAKRLMAVLEAELADRDWIAGDYSIADIAIAPWLRALEFYGVKELLGWDDHPNLIAYLDRFVARPAVQKGLVTPPRS